MDSGDPNEASFAARLDKLFRTVVNPETGKQYSVRAVAAEVGVSHTHMNKLRTGKATDPRVSEMESIAVFFGVSLSYFTEELARASDATKLNADSQKRLAAALSRPGVKRVAQRMADVQLSDEGVAAVVAMIDQVVQLEEAARRRHGGTSDRGRA